MLILTAASLAYGLMVSGTFTALGWQVKNADPDRLGWGYGLTAVVLAPVLENALLIALCELSVVCTSSAKVSAALSAWALAACHSLIAPLWGVLWSDCFC